MKQDNPPWINPMTGRARWYWAVQMAVVIAVTAGLAVILLLEPTPWRSGGAVASIAAGALCVWLARRGLKEAEHDFRTDDA